MLTHSSKDLTKSELHHHEAVLLGFQDGEDMDRGEILPAFLCLHVDPSRIESRLPFEFAMNCIELRIPSSCFLSQQILVHRHLEKCAAPSSVTDAVQVTLV